MPSDRQAVLDRLHRRIDAGEAVIFGAAGVGLVAAAARSEDIDVLMTYNIAKFRMDGHPSIIGYLPYGDANAITVEMAARVIPVAGDVPVIAGVGAADPYRTLDQLLDGVLAAGYSGVTNTPTAGVYEGEMRRLMESSGIGYEREIEMARRCRERDIFTVLYAFSPEDASALAAAGTDVIAAHLGNTKASASPAEDIADAIRRTQEMIDAARAVDPNVMVVAHGGPLENAESVAKVLAATSAVGYIAGSSMERLPVVASVRQAAKQMRQLKLGSRATSTND